jgi:hypothetical protein
MVHEDGLHCPKIFCDFCEKQIAESGNVVWLCDLEKDEQCATSILFAHKGCDKQYTSDGAFYLWQELDSFLFYLFNNSKIDFNKAKEHAKLLASF